MIEQFFDNNWLIIVAVLLGLYLFATPLITKFTFQLEAQTTLHLIDIDSRLGDESDEYMDEASRKLAELGFEPICLASLPQSTSNVKLWIKLFHHPQNQDDAAIELFYLEQGGQWKPHQQCVEFGSEYADGTMVITGNQDVFNVWPIAEEKTLSMFSGVTDLGWLYQAHTAICKSQNPGKRKVDPLYADYNGDAATYLADGMNREHQPAVKARYLYYRRGTPGNEPPGGGEQPNPYAPPSAQSVPAQYGATLKGAYLMSWQLLWPFNRFIKRWRVRQSYARLKQAEFIR